MDNKEKLEKIDVAIKWNQEDMKRFEECDESSLPYGKDGKDGEIETIKDTISELQKLKEDFINGTDNSKMMFFLNGITIKI